MKIKLLIGLLVVLISSSSSTFANETARTMGDRSWQFGTPFETQVRLNMAVARELQDRYRNPRKPRKLGVGNRGLGVGSGGVYIANVENLGVIGSSQNIANQSVIDIDGNNNKAKSGQKIGQNDQDADVNINGNSTGSNSPIINN